MSSPCLTKGEGSAFCDDHRFALIEQTIVASIFRSQSLRGHKREFVSELVDQVRSDEIAEPSAAINGQSDPVITPVAIQGSLNIPLILQQLQKEKLVLSIELLSVQIHRVSRFTTIVHEPHRHRERTEYDLRNPLPPRLIEQSVIKSQLRKAPGHESTSDPIPVAFPQLRRCGNQRFQMSVLPIDIELLVNGVVDFKKCVGLAAHCTVTHQGSDDDFLLHSRQTSHGVAHCAQEARQFRGSPL
jgi:hypothetical protein